MESITHFAMYLAFIISLFAVLYVYKFWKKTAHTGDEEGQACDIEDPFCYVTTDSEEFREGATNNKEGEKTDNAAHEVAKEEIPNEIAKEAALEDELQERREAFFDFCDDQDGYICDDEVKGGLVEEICQESDICVLDMAQVTRDEAESVLAEMKEELDVPFDRKDHLLAWLQEHGEYAQDLVRSFPDLRYELDLLILEAQTQFICMAA